MDLPDSAWAVWALTQAVVVSVYWKNLSYLLRIWCYLFVYYIVVQLGIADYSIRSIDSVLQVQTTSSESMRCLDPIHNLFGFD